MCDLRRWLTSCSWDTKVLEHERQEKGPWSDGTAEAASAKSFKPDAPPAALSSRGTELKAELGLVASPTCWRSFVFPSRGTDTSLLLSSVCFSTSLNSSFLGELGNESSPIFSISSSVRGASSSLCSTSTLEAFFSLALRRMARVEGDALLGEEAYGRQNAHVKTNNRAISKLFR